MRYDALLEPVELNAESSYNENDTVLFWLGNNYVSASVYEIVKGSMHEAGIDIEKQSDAEVGDYVRSLLRRAPTFTHPTLPPE